MTFAFWLLVALAHLPLVVVHFSWMWRQEAYHYLPALGLAIGLLFAIRWDRVLRLPGSRSAWAALTLSSCVVMPAAVWWYSPWLGAVALIFSLGAFLLSQRPSPEALEQGALFRLWPLAWLVLPLPMNMDQALTAALQLRSSRLSSYVLDLLEIPHVLLGNVIQLASGRLFVEEACSGVQSLYTLIFCAVLIVVVLGRAMALLPVYIALAILWAGLMNVLRIVSIAAVRHWYELDWSHGWQHSAIGYVSLGVAVLLLLSSDRAMRVLFFPAKVEVDAPEDTNPLVSLWNLLFWNGPRRQVVRETLSVGRVRGLAPAFMALAVALCLWQSVQAVGRLATLKRDANAPEQPFLAVPEAIPASAVKNFVQAKHEQVRGNIDLPMGDNADVWRGAIAGVPVAIVLSQPYPSWHDLTLCYRGQGWQLNDRKIVSAVDAEGRAWDYTLSSLLTERGGYGYVWYCGFDQRGEHVECSNRSLLSRLRSRAGGDSSDAGGQVAMLQLVLESEAALDPALIEVIDEAFRESREFLISVARR